MQVSLGWVLFTMVQQGVLTLVFKRKQMPSRLLWIAVSAAVSITGIVYILAAVLPSALGFPILILTLFLMSWLLGWVFPEIRAAEQASFAEDVRRAMSHEEDKDEDE